MNVGCCGFGCCVNWMLRSWMLQYSPIFNTHRCLCRLCSVAARLTCYRSVTAPHLDSKVGPRRNRPLTDDVILARRDSLARGGATLKHRRGRGRGHIQLHVSASTRQRSARARHQGTPARRHAVGVRGRHQRHRGFQIQTPSASFLPAALVECNSAALSPCLGHRWLSPSTAALHEPSCSVPGFPVKLLAECRVACLGAEPRPPHRAVSRAQETRCAAEEGQRGGVEHLGVQPVFVRSGTCSYTAAVQLAVTAR